MQVFVNTGLHLDWISLIIDHLHLQPLMFRL